MPSNTCFLKLPHFSEIITKEICRAIYKEGLDLQLAHSEPSLHQYLTKKNNNTITTCILANYPIRDLNICQKICLICLKCHNLYIGSTIRPLKEHFNTHVSPFHKHLIRCKNSDNNFSIKIEARVHNVGNIRIKEALLIAKLHPQINSRLELDTEYIIN